ncbi:MAG TPA: disulfide bond formation protein B [Methyloceanibacter sp.]|nr:disulfide bond formation protein B [Methyloceanibacter sp.]
MTPDHSRLLNALGLIAINTLLVLAFIDQIWFRDLPCPLCILQRAAFVAAGFGLALNLLFGARPSHYGVTVLGSVAGAVIAGRQVLIHIVPGTGSYGNPIFGLHLYTWALIAFGVMVIGTAIMLLFDRQFQGELLRPRMDIWALMSLTIFAAVIVANIFSTLLLCGVGFCPDNPTDYLIFRDNLSVTSG